MSIFKYLTLSHLQKVLAALETRFKSIDNKIESLPNSDWNENDSNSKSFVQNRTHYTDDPVTSEVWSHTFEEENGHYDLALSDNSWTQNLVDGNPYSINFNGTTYTGNLFCNSSDSGYIVGNLYMWGYSNINTGEPFIIRITSDFIEMSVQEEHTSPNLFVSLSITSRNVHKLDSKYLDGYLISSGYQLHSEVFNGKQENEFFDCSLTLSGEANATEYSFTGSGIPDELSNICPLLRLSGYEEIRVESIQINSGNQTGTIVFNSTLNKTEAVTDLTVDLRCPNKVAYGYRSHAEGDRTKAFGNCSHAEGDKTTASGDSSHAEGSRTYAYGGMSHAEGGTTRALGDYSHAEGFRATASGKYSHAGGYNTTASGACQHVQGRYNIEDSTNDYAHIVGNGTVSARSNAHTLDWSGNGWYAGKLTVGVAPTNDMDVATKKYVDENSGGGTVSELSDTSILSPTNGQILMYNSTTGKWENTSLPIYSGEVTEYWEGGSY